MLRCPRCSEVLSRKRVAGVELDGCRACGGSFFDAGELTTIARDPVNLLAVDDAFRAVQPALKPQSTNACPRCQTTMTKFEQPSLRGIELDACKTCKGIWLDGGEPTEIAKRRGVVVLATGPAPQTAVAATPSPPPVSPAEAADRLGVRLILGLTAAVALIAVGHSLRLIRQEHASGQVVSIERTGYGRRSHSRAVVRYAVDGRNFTIHSSLAFDFLSTGDMVEVLYPRDAPDDGTVDTFWGIWGLPLFIVTMGAIFAARFSGRISLR
ncbi:MAG: zf-TFIIB domain-containing protein [Deltaproteobacteria bacterium]|nr:zf-TFIIB domain-containing protein [Deltaproteobacteria bacterium]